MDKVMPQIQMPPKEEEVKEAIPDSGKITDKELINQIQEEVLEENYDDEPLINITERVIPDENDVFGEPPVPKVKPILNEEEPTLMEEEGDPPPQQEFKPTGKRKYTRRAPMSQKQKDHLAKIRKIASEKRAKEREKKEQEKIRKEEEKEEARIKKAEERLLAKQNKEKKVSKPQPIPEAQPQSSGMIFTREDMEKAMFSAISSYEIVRKREKEEKKKRELAEARERQMQRTLQQAIQPQTAPDPWRQYFS
tara:strand:+ start:2110 stop:2862 length:753 start_codon:yes stop_codon:yes gene_type:complete